MKRIASIAFMLFFCCMLSFAQKYNVVDKTVAVVGNEAIMISDIESEVKNQRAQGMASDRHLRCDILEAIKLCDKSDSTLEFIIVFGNPF